MTFSSKAITAFFYEPHDMDHFWRCKRCYDTPKQAKRCDVTKGYTNLINHLQQCIGPDYISTMADHVKSNNLSIAADGSVSVNQRDLKNYFASNEKENNANAYMWMKWIVMRNMPIREMDNKITPNLGLAHKSFNSKTMRRWIITTAMEAEKSIAKEFKDMPLLSLVFDGWSCEGTGTHYTAIFAAYPDPKSAVLKEVLLTIQPMLQEDDFTADAHVDLLNSTLELYEIQKQKVVCLSGDNCSVNQSLARKWEVPRVGCYSHRLNLAVKAWISKEEGLPKALDKLGKSMGKASTNKAAAQLRNLRYERHGKELAAKRLQETRWTSNMVMVDRYFRIKGELEQCKAVEKYLLDRMDDRTLSSARDAFKTFYFLTLELQEHGVDLHYAREQFDLLLEDERFASMEHHIGKFATIVKSPDFESGLCKMISNEMLNAEEADACLKLASSARTRTR